MDNSFTENYNYVMTKFAVEYARILAVCSKL